MGQKISGGGYYSSEYEAPALPLCNQLRFLCRRQAVIQDTLGHKDISTTLNIYTDVTKELRRSEFEGLDSYFKNEYNKANEVL